MGVESEGGARRRGFLWIFMHGTNIVDRGLIALFFGLFCYYWSFSVALLPLEEAY